MIFQDQSVPYVDTPELQLIVQSSSVPVREEAWRMEDPSWSQEPSRSTTVIEASSSWVLPGEFVGRMGPGLPRGYLSVVSSFTVLLRV